MQFPRQITGRGLLIALIVVCSVATLTSVTKAQIVAFGASNVAGKGVFPNQAWPAVLEGLLRAKGYNVHVKNAGISGDTTKHMLQRLDSSIPPGTTIVILDVGGGFYNNSKTDIPREQGKADMEAIEARLRSRGIKIVPELSSKMPLNLKQADHIHLTAEGHRVYAEELLPRVIAALGSSHSG